ncbi:PREDICTED: DNA-3-methyladenine glycosylase 1 [Theobroma cacao]|uniref:DNA-3-methyladenine glycosylase 1 n=1 Tax=Theobroma cacao TaxID=3641 RepID=A0AB32VUG2_THECC|nr:PREDICTED: DNA-3-methyladenine glycosylase 1 [Theobroma cacao]
MNPPPQTPTITTRSTVRTLCGNPSTPSKIPFRPRKIRKVISNTPVDNATKSPQPSLTVAPKIPKSLSTKPEIDLALNHLRTSDPLLAALISAHPPPKLSPCHSYFVSLSKSILFQQLATKAANSIYTRFVSLCGNESNVLPNTVLSLTPQKLREIGVSVRKASYLHDLSDKFSTGVLSDTSILTMDDETLFQMLTAVKGIGPWSVHMFMIFSLHRPDVLPVGDLGVRKGVQFLYGLKELPKPLQVEQICEKWKPYRSVGSWYMWRLVEAKPKGNGKAQTVEAEQNGGF